MPAFVNLFLVYEIGFCPLFIFPIKGATNYDERHVFHWLDHTPFDHLILILRKQQGANILFHIDIWYQEYFFPNDKHVM